MKQQRHTGLGRGNSSSNYQSVNCADDRRICRDAATEKAPLLSSPEPRPAGDEPMDSRGRDGGGYREPHGYSHPDAAFESGDSSYHRRNGSSRTRYSQDDSRDGRRVLSGDQRTPASPGPSGGAGGGYIGDGGYHDEYGVGPSSTRSSFRTNRSGRETPAPAPESYEYRLPMASQEQMRAPLHESYQYKPQPYAPNGQRYDVPETYQHQQPQQQQQESQPMCEEEQYETQKQRQKQQRQPQQQSLRKQPQHREIQFNSGPKYNDVRLGALDAAGDGTIGSGGGGGRGGAPLGTSPLFEQVPEDILSVRLAALSVLQPLTYTWLIVSMGFSMTIGLGLARWTSLLEDVPYWVILAPSWCAHLGLLITHILSAKALSTFIADANDNRQQRDSTDHLDRTEYLPLLQRSLKFGLKTGLLSLCIFVFEVLLYAHVAKGAMTIAAALTPLWIIVCGAILDGLVCKTQNLFRVLCWALMFSTMLLLVLKIDYAMEEIRWRIVVAPIVALLSMSSATLIYIVYGHQVGYYRLSEFQLTAGILYSLAALLCIILVVLMGEFIPYLASEDVETRLLVVGLGPAVMILVGMGAWAVSRDTFDRLLKYGGQAAVHPMRLRLDPEGWTAVEGPGVANIPMFGEVAYEPLRASEVKGVELCGRACCACYPNDDA